MASRKIFSKLHIEKLPPNYSLRNYLPLSQHENGSATIHTQGISKVMQQVQVCKRINKKRAKKIEMGPADAPK